MYVEGGKTPMVALDRLADFRIALFANLALQASIRGMQRVTSKPARAGAYPGDRAHHVRLDTPKPCRRDRGHAVDHFVTTPLVEALFRAATSA